MTDDDEVVAPTVADRHAANLPDREQRAHANRLQDLSMQLQGWVGKEAFGCLAPQRHLCKRSASQIIAAIAAELEIDLVVMGTVSRMASCHPSRCSTDGIVSQSRRCHGHRRR